MTLAHPQSPDIAAGRAVYVPQRGWFKVLDVQGDTVTVGSPLGVFTVPRATIMRVC